MTTPTKRTTAKKASVTRLPTAAKEPVAEPEQQPQQVDVRALDPEPSLAAAVETYKRENAMLMEKLSASEGLIAAYRQREYERQQAAKAKPRRK